MASFRLTQAGQARSTREIFLMTDDAEKRGQLIRDVEEVLALADEIEDGQTGFLIEHALDGAITPI
jgi:hypothetical protein